MLGKLISKFWPALRGPGETGERNMRSGGVPVGEEVRAAINSFLREPLAHPAIIDYELVARLKAAADAADYMVAHMMNGRNLVRRAELLEYALGVCAVEGLILELGVFRGESLRFIAKRVKQDVHGFDSFEGLPEDWTYFQKQGRFSLDGQVPEFQENNIRVYKGWFEQSLPPFLAGHPGAARLIHIDCDIYSSTSAVLRLLAPRIVSGTVIVFDEYLGYPSWQQHEFRAFREFVAAQNLRYRYAGFASSHTSVAVVVD